MISSTTKICCLIGNPVNHSLSPQLHNACYNYLGLDYVYLAFKVTNLKKAIDGLKELGIKGISVTIPHKEEVIKYVDEIDEVAKDIGAVNTIISKNGKLIARNTDWLAALGALEKVTALKNKKVALIGAGGAAKAILYGLVKSGANVYIFNRTFNNAEELGKKYNIKNIYKLSQSRLIKDCDIVINSTSVGMYPEINRSPIPKKFLSSNQLVFDIVYSPLKTQLIRDAQSSGATTITGDRMLIYACFQFELFTGIKAPVDIMESILLKYLK